VLFHSHLTSSLGFRTNAAETDFSKILPEDLEATIKAASEISMGTEISDSDIAHIHSLCDQVIDIANYRTQLAEYLRNRMTAIAPNLTALVGELVGARLIAHAGSLLTLAKHPASTVQILGAEKALFRALKTKHDTPKYGLIYHASLIGQAPPKLKGKMARMVATKAALSIRVDALSDADGKSAEDAPTIGLENRAKLESRLRALEHQSDLGGVRRGPGAGPRQARAPIGGAPRTYNDAADAPTLVSAQRDPMEAAVAAVLDVKEEKRKAKEERRAKRKEQAKSSEDGNGMDVDEADSNADSEKKRKRRESAVEDVQMLVCITASFGSCSLLTSSLPSRLSRKRRRPSGKRGRRLARPRRPPLLLRRLLRRTHRQKTERRRRRRRSRISFSMPLVCLHHCPPAVFHMCMLSRLHVCSTSVAVWLRRSPRSRA
jgi:nucleolar protein 58